MNKASTFCIFLFLLSFSIDATDYPNTRNSEVTFSENDGKLQLQVRIKGLLRRKDGSLYARVGDILEYSLQVENISESTLTFPGRLQDKLEVHICRAEAAELGWLTVGRTFSTTTIEPGKSLKSVGKVKILYPDVNHLRIVFSNYSTTYDERKLVASGKPDQHGNINGRKVWVESKLENCWTGSLDISNVLSIPTHQSLEEWMRSISPQGERYSRAIRRLDECRRTGGLSIKEKRTDFPAKTRLIHQNITPQSEVFEQIRGIGADGNMYSVEWLWDAFEGSAKNSPVHLLCMAELYGLFMNGIGVEHLDKFLEVANSSYIDESITTRSFAMDALVLVLTRDHFECASHGNQFFTKVSDSDKQKARQALEALAKDRLKDVKVRASRILGLKARSSTVGERKYIKPPQKTDAVPAE